MMDSKNEIGGIEELSAEQGAAASAFLAACQVCEDAGVAIVFADREDVSFGDLAEFERHDQTNATSRQAYESLAVKRVKLPRAVRIISSDMWNGRR